MLLPDHPADIAQYRRQFYAQVELLSQAPGMTRLIRPGVLAWSEVGREAVLLAAGRLLVPVLERHEKQQRDDDTAPMTQLFADAAQRDGTAFLARVLVLAPYAWGTAFTHPILELISTSLHENYFDVRLSVDY